MQTQRGITLIGLIFALFAVAIGALIMMKIVPAYIDYFTVKNSLENIIRDNAEDTNESLRKTFDARLNVNYIQNLSSRDLVIEREGGLLTLSVPISRKEHLAGGISVCVELEARAATPLK